MFVRKKNWKIGAANNNTKGGCEIMQIIESSDNVIESPQSADQGSDATALQSAIRKVTWRTIPLLSLAFLFNYLDRTSVGFAAITMRHDIGLSATQFGYGAGIMFATYCLFEVPSNLALHKFGGRRWLARIMISWGLAAAATAFVVGPQSFYAVRLLLGTAEAGFYPGVLYYLTIWFPKEYRTRAFSWFAVAVPVSSLVGGPLSAWLLHLDGVGGLAGWQWMFIIEGLPATILGFFILAMLSDVPEKASWLSEEERNALTARLSADAQGSSSRHRFLPVLRDPRVYILALTSFSFTLASYGLGIWLPQIISGFGVSTYVVGWLSAIPYLFGTAGLLAWAAYVDRRGRRMLHVALACGMAAVALALSGAFSSLRALMVVMTVAVVGISSARVIFFTIPSLFLRGEAAAGGLALINCIGALGGWAGPYMLGYLLDRSGSFRSGLFAISGVMLFAAALPLSLRIMLKDE